MTNKKSHTRLTSRLIRAIGDRIAPRAKGEGRLCIVNYHRVLKTVDPLLASEPDVATFRWQMELLADCFNVMPLHDAVFALKTKRMPPRAVSISFDDGYRSMYENALPILMELNLPATVFVTSGYVDQGNVWNDTIVEAIRTLPHQQLDLRDVGLNVYSLQTLDDRKHAIHVLTEESKYLPPSARLDLTAKLKQLIHNTSSQGAMLTREMVSSLAQQGIEIGGHTISHPILTGLEDECARYEIVGGKHQLEQITGKPVRLFAYPNGKVGVDFDQRHADIAKEAGFSAAFTTATGAATPDHNLFQLPRSRPWDSTPYAFGARLLYWLSGRNS